MNCDCGKGADVAMERGQVLARAPFPPYVPCDNPAAVEWYCADCSPMTIKAHCMGMEFPKRDTDSPNVTWARPLTFIDRKGVDRFWATFGEYLRENRDTVSPSAADLDAVAEEQRVKEKTSGE